MARERLSEKRKREKEKKRITLETNRHATPRYGALRPKSLAVFRISRRLKFNLSPEVTLAGPKLPATYDVNSLEIETLSLAAHLAKEAQIYVHKYTDTYYACMHACMHAYTCIYMYARTPSCAQRVNHSRQNA